MSFVSVQLYYFRSHEIVLGLSGIFVPGYPSGMLTGTHYPGTRFSGKKDYSIPLHDPSLNPSSFAPPPTPGQMEAPLFRMGLGIYYAAQNN